MTALVRPARPELEEKILAQPIENEPGASLVCGAGSGPGPAFVARCAESEPSRCEPAERLSRPTCPAKLSESVVLETPWIAIVPLCM